jgi:VIT family
MLASTLSMGAGAYLAAKSEAEVYEAEISRERAEVEENPEEEIEKMSLFYQLQGFTPDESQKMAERLAQHSEQFVQAMAQSELGLSEHRFPNHWTAAFSAGISTAIGAFVPIIPFFFSGGVDAVLTSFGISLVAHFLVGALKSLITIRSWWASGLENDLDWHHRRSCHLRARTCLWFVRLSLLDLQRRIRRGGGRAWSRPENGTSGSRSWNGSTEWLGASQAHCHHDE